MKMQKSPTVQYLRPESPPSIMKKSPLAMLVETCSNIGQELTRSSKNVDSTILNESRKSHHNTSPSHLNKPSTPRSSGSSPSGHQTHRPAAISTTKMVAPNTVHGSSSLMNLASQYQLMYQQLLYQTELEHIRAKELAAQQKTLNSLVAKSMDFGGSKPLCPICSLSPGYAGYCIHDELAINPLLAMFNPVSMAYNKYADPSLISQSNKTQSSKDSSISPPAAHEGKKSPYTASSMESKSPSSTKLSASTEQVKPIDLHIRNRSPAKAPPAQKECHWVGTTGYCGQKFDSQEDLMEHLKIHVCLASGEHITNKHSSLHTYKDLTSKDFNKRFQPYSFTERNIPPLRH